MKRNLMKELIKWKGELKKQPLILTGIKGAGKTYLTLDFAKSFYEGSLYINFETNAMITAAYEKNELLHKPLDFFDFIGMYFEIHSGLLSNILIILDEMQCSGAAYLSFIKSVKAYNDLSCILITSEVNSYSELAFQNFNRLRLYPLEFDEFLTAFGYEWYVEIIIAHSKKNRQIPDIVHRELLGLFDDYLTIGGMPAAVNEYLNMESSENISQIHQNIFYGIQMYNMTKYSESHSLKMKQIYETLESQILKEHTKFQYRPIRKGATYAMFKDAINDLKGSGQLLMCNKLIGIKDSIPDYSEASFKLYYFDTGILNYILNKNLKSSLFDESIKKKLLIKNYTLQSLTAKGYEVFFWESNSQARIDFLIKNKDGVIPIDIKAGDIKRSKSLSVYKNEYDYPYSVKLTNKNFDLDRVNKTIPCYAIFSMF